MEAWNEMDHVSVATNDSQRAVAFSRQLQQAHQHLRDQLTRIRGQLRRIEPAETELPVHCLAFCSALTTHHVGEGDGMFRELLDARPDLAPTIQNLIDDHAAIVESHFGYEERAISAALDNHVPDTGWSRPVFRPTEPQHPVP